MDDPIADVHVEEEDRPVPNSNYKTCWKKFTGHVDNQLEGPVDVNGDGVLKYITRENVDSFFYTVIPTLTVQPDTVSRYRTAIQWYANHWEYPTEGHEFLVDCRVVQDAINKHATQYLLLYSIRNHDAHAGLPTNVLSDDDHLRALRQCFSTNPLNWQDFALSFTGCHATYIRQDTMRKLFLCHLRADEAHGPPGCTSTNQTILSLVLEPGMRKDDTVENRSNQPRAGRGGGGGAGRRKAPTQYKKRVVGAYRHKSVFQCFTGMVGTSLVYRFHDAQDLSFLQPANKKARPGWQKENLLPSWKATEGGGEIMCRVLHENCCGTVRNRVEQDYSPAQCCYGASLIARPYS